MQASGPACAEHAAFVVQACITTAQMNRARDVCSCCADAWHWKRSVKDADRACLEGRCTDSEQTRVGAHISAVSPVSFRAGLRPAAAQWYVYALAPEVRDSKIAHVIADVGLHCACVRLVPHGGHAARHCCLHYNNSFTGRPAGLQAAECGLSSTPAQSCAALAAPASVRMGAGQRCDQHCTPHQAAHAVLPPQAVSCAGRGGCSTPADQRCGASGPHMQPCLSTTTTPRVRLLVHASSLIRPQACRATARLNHPLPTACEFVGHPWSRGRGPGRRQRSCDRGARVGDLRRVCCGMQV